MKPSNVATVLVAFVMEEFAAAPAFGLQTDEPYSFSGPVSDPYRRAMNECYKAWKEFFSAPGGLPEPAKVEVHVGQTRDAETGTAWPAGTTSRYDPESQTVHVLDGPHAPRFLALEGTRQFLHLAFRDAYEKPQFPGWLEEGLAEYFSAAMGIDGTLAIHSPTALYTNSNLKAAQRTIETMPKLRNLLAMDRKTFYAQRSANAIPAWSFVWFLSNGPAERGRGTRRETLQRLLAAFASGMTRQQAYEQVWGKANGAITRLDQQWREYIKRQDADLPRRTEAIAGRGTFLIRETEHYTIQVQTNTRNAAAVLTRFAADMEVMFANRMDTSIWNRLTRDPASRILLVRASNGGESL